MPRRGHIIRGASGRQRRVLIPAKERAMSKQTEPSIVFAQSVGDANGQMSLQTSADSRATYNAHAYEITNAITADSPSCTHRIKFAACSIARSGKSSAGASMVSLTAEASGSSWFDSSAHEEGGRSG